MELKEITSTFKKPLEKIFSILGEELQHTFSNRLLEYQTEEYKRNYFSKTLLHRSEPKCLTEFYQPLFIKKFAEQTHPEKRISTSSTKKLLNKWNCITLIGNAGSGKSTIIKYLYTNCFKEQFKIPIKIELRYLNEFDGSISEYIYDQIFHFHKIGFSERIIDRLLSSDSFAFFLDGYDELNSNIKAKTTKDIDSFVQKFPNNKYVITSRPYTSIDLLPLFSNFEVCDLDENEIAAFVKKQIPIEEIELAEKIIKSINKSENRSYRSFLSNPLLLSMFILTFQSFSDIPQKRSEFYDQVFDTLFSIHDSISKLAFVRERLSGLAKDQFEEILQLFSFLSFFEEKFVFSSNYLTDKLEIIKSKKSNIDFNNERLIDDLQVAIGILNKEGLDYTFPHRSLQEYFASLYITKLGPDNKKKLYDKLNREIQSNPTTLLRREHFFLLLVEMDYNNICQYVSIPTVERFLLELQGISNPSSGVIHEYYGKLMLSFHILLDTYKNHPAVHLSIFEEELAYAFFGEGDDVFKVSKEDEKNFYSGERGMEQIELMKKALNNFIVDGANTIKKFRKKLIDDEQSDSEIINLI
ncbi:NACHT domain-containing protein [Marinoscillum pacificum]|uniref:NACHT domain-containing protein n=1 Tax=Marinoscillum pacificum TaxID=392723 RepID=UPI0021583DBF|nr:NACHT domain-containing protein [Marinoscillum pacificum]